MLPADHHVHHCAGKQRLESIVAAVAGVARHVAQRIDLNQRGNDRDDGQHEEA